MQLVDLKWFAHERRQRVLSRLSWARVFLQPFLAQLSWQQAFSQRLF